ncbi:NAD-dependent epimerase/dehydratase family protein, partial [Candidatus Bathyarchaeota archaeon]
MKVLVTGAGGFIGGHMANYLKKRGYEVIACDIKPNPWQPVPNFYLADLRNYKDCRRLVEGVDWVFQFAANMGGIGYITQVKADVMHDNVLINANMLRASVDAGVKRFFFASSACVYPEELQADDKKVAFLKESDAFPAHPDTAYGWEKLFTEIMCKS